MKNHKPKINIYLRAGAILISILILAPFFLIGVESKACSCPLTSQDGRIIVNIDARLVQANEPAGPINVSIPQGSYDVTLVTYETASRGQENESWYLVLKNAQGSVVATTPIISDIPSNLDYLTEKVATNFSISDNVSKVLAYHAATISGPASSVTAVCAAFDRVNNNPPDLIITKAVNKTTASPGEEVIYTLDYKNIGDTAATGVVIQDKLDYINQEYITFISSSPSPSSGNNTWNIGTLNPGQSGQISIRVKVKDTVPQGTIEIKNRGSIDSNETPFMYSNCANFTVTLSGQPDLRISKSVDKTNADPNDIITYTLTYQNVGQRSATNIVIKDPFNNLNQNYLDFISSSPSPSSGNDTWNIGTLTDGSFGTITIRAKIRDSIPNGSTEINNRANIDSNETSLIYSNYVSTWVYKTEINDNPDLNIDKLVRNITDGSSNWTTSVYAEPGDELEFRIRIESIGDETAKNIRVRDELPSKLEYVSGSTRVDGSYRSDGIISSSGIYVDDLGSGNDREIKFKAKVKSESNFSSTTTTLTNYAYTRASDVSEIYDTAQVRVQKEQTQESKAISINKLGRNISRGDTTWYDSFIAEPGQEIEFSVQVTNIGNTTLENVRIWDTLPVKMIIVGAGSTYGSGIVGSGINIGSLSSGEARTIQVRTKLDAEDSFDFGSTTLINIAYTAANGVNQVSDQASVVVVKGEVKGITTIKTGPGDAALAFLIVISFIAAIYFYCKVREEKLLEILNNENSKKPIKALIRLYFQTKFIFTAMRMRFKRVYW